LGSKHETLSLWNPEGEEFLLQVAQHKITDLLNIKIYHTF